MKQHIPVHATFLCATLVFVGIIAGCSRDAGPQVVPVSGTVTRSGQPVANVFLNFGPTQGRPSWAITDANGRYELEYDSTQKGAVVGNHTVWVTQPITGTEGMGADLEPKVSPDLTLILQKYGQPESSPLKIEVKSGNATIDLQLD